MEINLIVEPRKTYSWSVFKKRKPSYSIALDGIVLSPTRRAPKTPYAKKGPFANYDHHSGVDRAATLSTSAQVHLEINMGLFNAFSEDGIPKANIYVNDCDEDTCLAYWLLKNHERVNNHAEPLINQLVYCEDKLDVTAGAYPFGNIEMRRRMAWIFEPYNNARFNQTLHIMDAFGMKAIMEAVEKRIDEHVMGKGNELELKGQYEIIEKSDLVTFVIESGPASRMQMYNDGIDAFVALVAQKPDNYNVYVMGRRSVWTPFDLMKFARRFNKLEKRIITKNNQWGGSNTIIGSPRRTGSLISIPEMWELVVEG
ncbi:MAG: hypothetical protein KKG59_05455 [Nanoarchaeota archaeon]|nr:hypothetical protein [Nanoarchaeota archaeon]